MRPPVGAVRAASAARALADRRTDGLAASQTDWAVQGAGTRLNSDMAGHTQPPSGRENPCPAPSPSPCLDPGPGASERVALKKEIGLVSACTIIIGERCPRRVGAWGGRAEGLGAQTHGTTGSPPSALLLVCDGGNLDEGTPGAPVVSPHTAVAGLLVSTSPGARNCIWEVWVPSTAGIFLTVLYCVGFQQGNYPQFSHP